MRIAGSTPIARYAERKERHPRVAILDSFAKGKEAPRHGDQVEDIITRTSGLDDRKIQNYQNSYSLTTTSEDVFNASNATFKKQLRKHTIGVATGFYQATKENLESVLSDENTKVRVINQSQSQCAARVSRGFVDKIMKDDDFRMKMKEVFALPEKAHVSTVAEALLEEVQNVFDRSRYVANARNEYMEVAKKVFDKGIAHVVTAGNLGRVTEHWEKNGIKAPKNAYRSVLAHDYTTIIGATASQGTITTRDDKAASFTSVYAGAEFAMHGVNVEVLDDDPSKDSFSNGTSFAAPQATSLIYEIFETNPDLTVPKMEDILYKSTIPVLGTQEQVGAGQVDPERALYLAVQSKFVGGRDFEKLAQFTQPQFAVR